MLKKGAAVCYGASSRLIALLVVVTCLSGCTASSAFRERLYPKPPPTAAAIRADYESFNEALQTIRRKTPELSVDDALTAYTATGYDMAEKACLDFFVRVRQIRNDTAFAKDAMRNAVASAGLISALATAPTSVLAGLFGATGAAPAVVEDFEKIFLFADASDSLYPQIFSVMQKYRDKFPAQDHTQVTVLTAETRVRQHATLCSLPFLTNVVRTGVKDVRIEKAKSAAERAKETPPGVAPPSVVPLGAMEIK